MRVVVLTSVRRGTASLCLPLLAEHSDIEVTKVVFCLGHYKSRWRKLRRDVKKVIKIGPMGSYCGYRMRNWGSGEEQPEDVMDIAARYGIPDVVKGSVITAIASSLPELATALLAIPVHDDFELGLSVIIGSAIYNILVIPA